MARDANAISAEGSSGQPPEFQAVLRLSGAEAKAYLKTRILPEHPVILTDVMRDVPAMKKWTLSFFESHYPDLAVEVDGRPVTMREQLRYIVDSTAERPAPYPFSFSITEKAPDLMKDLMPFISFGRSDRTVHPWMPGLLTSGTIVHEMFFGGRGSSFPQLHYDLLGMNTQITQVMGNKEFFFFDPSQTPYLYPKPETPSVSGVNNIFTPDLERFPLFSKARALIVMVHEGETVYFPARWWHITRIHGPSITYGRAVVNASNWHLMMRENLERWRATRPGMALPGYVFGNALGRIFNVMEALA